MYRNNETCNKIKPKKVNENHDTGYVQNDNEIRMSTLK